MSLIHDIPGGYTTAKGRHKDAKMLTMTPEERQELYQYLIDLKSLKDVLQIDEWNNHDEDVIPGVAQNVGPIHRGGRNRDITLDQVFKLTRALNKIRAALNRMDKKLPKCPVLDPTNLDEQGHIEPLTSKEVKKQMDVNRQSDADQKYLKENPDLITDTLSPFKRVWPKYQIISKK